MWICFRGLGEVSPLRNVIYNCIWKANKSYWNFIIYNEPIKSL